MAVSKSDILALFDGNLADENTDFTVPLAKNNSAGGKLTAEEYEIYKERIADGILKAMQVAPFTRHYMNVVLKSPHFKLGVSDAENPWTHAYYDRSKHCIVYLIKDPHFFNGGIDEAFIVFSLHEFGHAYFATIHSHQHYPPLLAKKDSLAFDYSTVPYYPVTDNSLQKFSKAIEFATVKIFWLLKWYKEDLDSFKKDQPELFTRIENVLKRYIKLPVMQTKVSCEQYSSEIAALASGERVVMSDIVSTVNNEPGAMFIPTRYSRIVENGKEYCNFLGTVGSASGAFPEDIILAILYNLNILLARPHTEAYRKLYASYGPFVGHKVFGETIAVLFEGNVLLELYPQLITLHFDNRLARAKQLGLPTELDPDVKDFISNTKSTLTLLKAIKTREIEERLQTRVKSPQEIAKKIEDTQTQTAITLFACVTAIPHVAGSILYGMLSATEQFARLGYTEDEHSSGNTVSSIGSILPIAVGASITVAAAAATYCFWYRDQKNSKATQKEVRNDGPRRVAQQKK